MHKGGDFGTKRAKFDQEEGDIHLEQQIIGDKVSNTDQHASSSRLNFDASTSSAEPPARFQSATIDQLPREMHGMTISEDKVGSHIEKVDVHASFCYVAKIFHIL